MDLKILLELIKDPRIQIAELSDELGIARNTAQSRVKRLLRSGVLHAAGREVDLEKVGYDVVAFVTIEVTHRELDGVIGALRLIPQVLGGPRNLRPRRSVVPGGGNRYPQPAVGARARSSAPRESSGPKPCWPCTRTSRTGPSH